MAKRAPPKGRAAAEVSLVRKVVVAASEKRRQAREAPRPGLKTRSRPAGYRRRSCWLCKQHIRDVDYKDVALLGRYLSDRGKIRSRDKSGACRRHQRLVAVAIKRAARWRCSRTSGRMTLRSSAKDRVVELLR